MPNSLVCAVDLTDEAPNVVAYAHELAQKLEARLHVVHVCDVPRSPHPGTVRDGIDAASTELRALVQRGVPDDSEIALDVRVGITHLEVLDAAEEVDAAVIVLSSYARNLLQRALLGSTAEAVLKSSPRPVLTLPIGAPWKVPGSIVVAYDLESRACLELVAQLGPLGANVHVVHTIDADAELSTNEAVAQLDEHVRSTLSSEASTRVTSGKPLEALRAVLEERSPDLVVVGRSERSVLAMTFFGTTGIELVREPTVPVLMAPERPAEEA